MNIQKGYVGLTDPNWYSFLRNYPKVDEVNFWQPHGNRAFRALKPGDIFFFKLRAPQKAIAGFGFFQRYESLPAWLAWDCFSKMNGASSFDTMVEKLRLQAMSHGAQIKSILIGMLQRFLKDNLIFPAQSFRNEAELSPYE
ncbi:MAG: hypothetical protein KAH54_03975 [Candidatus Sabulitectum sp.]|nr:hypothetical protein [Candidatus Sabulitectum sp.]